MEQYKIICILEEDYNCEGVFDGQEPMCNVLLQALDGSEHWTMIADCYLAAHGLAEGDWLELSESMQTVTGE